MYEQYYNMELFGCRDIFIVPSQPQEKNLGFDVSGKIVLKKISSVLSKIAPLVSFARPRFNVFIQYKVPAYVVSKIKSCNIPIPQAGKYFWWHIYLNQNESLTALENIFSSSKVPSAVFYASPAFWKINNLVSHFLNGKIIDNSNHVRPSFIQQHIQQRIKQHKYVYTSPMGGNICSEPRSVETFDLNKFLNDHKKVYSWNDFIEDINRALPEDIRLGIENFLLLNDESRFVNTLSKILGMDNDLEKIIMFGFALLYINHFDFKAWGIGYERERIDENDIELAQSIKRVSCELSSLLTNKKYQDILMKFQKNWDDFLVYYRLI